MQLSNGRVPWVGLPSFWTNPELSVRTVVYFDIRRYPSYNLLTMRSTSASRIRCLPRNDLDRRPRYDQGLMRPGPAHRNPILPEEVHPVRSFPLAPPYGSGRMMLEEEERPIPMSIDAIEPTAVSIYDTGAPSPFCSINA